MLEVIELRKQGFSQRQIAEQLRVKRDAVRWYLKKYGYVGSFDGGHLKYKNNEDNVSDKVNIKYSKFEYAGGYTGSEGYLYLMCKDCGNIFKYNAQILRPKRNRNVQCLKCNSIQKEIKNVKNNLLKILKKRIYQLKTEEQKINNILKLQAKIKTKECVECGNEFKTTSKAILCCSKACSKKHMNNISDKRLYRNGVPDLTITLTKLIKTSKEICHICKQKVDVSDCYHTDEGYFIAGDNYPSIDHLRPLSKGGLHRWDNVKLAHRHCNTIKRDNIYYEEANNQIRLSI